LILDSQVERLFSEKKNYRRSSNLIRNARVHPKNLLRRDSGNTGYDRRPLFESPAVQRFT
jgi:hypothetical protein